MAPLKMQVQAQCTELLVDNYMRTHVRYWCRKLQTTQEPAEQREMIQRASTKRKKKENVTWLTEYDD